MTTPNTNTPAATPAPTPQPSREEQFSAAFAEALKAEGVVPSEQKAPEAQQPAEPKPEVKVETQPAATKKSWPEILREKAKERHEREALKQAVAQQPPIDQSTFNAIIAAKQRGDPLAVLNALGFSYQDVTSNMLGIKKEAPKEQPKQEPAKFELPPEVQERLRRIDELEQREQARQAQELEGAVDRAVKAAKEKLRYTAELGATPMVMKYLTDYMAAAGELPGKDFNESIMIAGEAVEEQLKQEHAKWTSLSSRLTPAQQAITVPSEPKSEGAAAAGSESAPGKTITNQLTPQTSVRPPEPKTRQDIVNQLLADPEVWK